jgi:toxin ParE1/3/4
LTIRWLTSATRSRFQQLDYIAEDNPTAAAGLDEEIERQTDMQAQYPLMGREGRVMGTRELAITGSPFVVVYRVTKTRIEILRLLHGAMRWPRE